MISLEKIAKRGRKVFMIGSWGIGSLFLNDCAEMAPLYAGMSTSSDPLTSAIGTVGYIGSQQDQQIRVARAGRSQVNVNVNTNQQENQQTKQQYTQEDLYKWMESRCIDNPPAGQQYYFFTCNRWRDINNDNKWNKDEFFGVKNKFRKDEPMCVLFLYLNGPKNKQTWFDYKLWSETGELLGEIRKDTKEYDNISINSQPFTRNVGPLTPNGQLDSMDNALQNISAGKYKMSATRSEDDATWITSFEITE